MRRPISDVCSFNNRTDNPIQHSLDVLQEFTFRKVHVKGRWDHAHTIFLTPRVHEGTKGVHVITPLIRSDGSTILVDRGFISDEFAKPELWIKPSAEQGEVDITGMLRTSQARNRFTPDNRPEKREWYWVDVNALADYAGGEAAGVQPVFVEAIFGMLLSRKQVLDFATENLNCRWSSR